MYLDTHVTLLNMNFIALDTNTKLPDLIFGLKVTFSGAMKLFPHIRLTANKFS